MVVGVAMVRDEADFIEGTIAHMGRHLDRLVIADNLSGDGTRDILERCARDIPIEIVDDTEPGYYQAAKMSRLAKRATRDLGADWIVPFDADERWVAENNARIADLLMSLPDEAMVAEASIIDHVATGDPAMPYRRLAVLPLRKVACRAVEGMRIHQGNHGVTFPSRRVALAVTGKLEVRHYPYRSPEQFIRKARNGAQAYAATDLPHEVGAHWRGYGKMTDEQLREVFFRWFWSGDPEHDPDLVCDPCPVANVG